MFYVTYMIFNSQWYKCRKISYSIPTARVLYGYRVKESYSDCLSR